MKSKMRGNNIDEHVQNEMNEYVNRHKKAIRQQEYVIRYCRERLDNLNLELTIQQEEQLKWEIANAECAIRNSERALSEHSLKRKHHMLEQSYRKPQPQKDNETLSPQIDNIQPGYGATYKIRVPKLKRKTAWKRFYKKFPHFKGLDSFKQPSFGQGGTINVGTIKLKKI